MLNQPRHPDLHPTVRNSSSLIDPPVGHRFGWLMTAYAAGIAVVMVRIAWVQAVLPERYLSVLNAVSTEYELIPARDGRILGAHATVLAADVDRYSVQMHYRLLQEPADEAWVRQQIRRKLTPEERRRPEAVNTFRNHLLEQHEDLRLQLISALNITSDDLNSRCRTIQQNVDRIAESVNRRRQQSESQSIPSGTSSGLLTRLAESVVRALTTEPQRPPTERIVVREEESWHEIAADVPLETAALIYEQPHRFPGIRVVSGNRRTYPEQHLAAHIIGARTAATPDETPLLNSDTTGTDTVRIGRFGVERAWNHQLQGVPGLTKTVRNRRYEIVSEETVRLPVSGRDVHLTLRADLQRHAERLLAEALLEAPAELLQHDDRENDSFPEQSQPLPTGGSI
ncbi:MAG: hypothetical protein KDA89_14220, partial [Planctomycetaceae bacterium]|nr:hypothetical protein [Planctomycetaceae bacterium]